MELINLKTLQGGSVVVFRHGKRLQDFSFANQVKYSENIIASMLKERYGNC